MDAADEAAEYDAMDHSTVNRVFVDDLLEASPTTPTAVLDVATGTGLIAIELAKRLPASELTACDRSDAMLRVAQANADRVGQPLTFLECDARTLPFSDCVFDCVMSNSLIHHLPGSPDDGYKVIQSVLAEMTRVTGPGGVVFIRDLMRPESSEMVESLVETYAGDETKFAQQLFRQSLHAALTLDEVRSITEALSLADATVEATSDRHWTLAAKL